MLIQPDGALRQPLSSTLGEEGHEVVLVERQATVLDQVQRNLPDVVVIDTVVTGGRRGLSTLKAVRALGPFGLLVLLARDDAQERIRGLNEGADDCLSRPFTLGELVARTGALLRRLGKAEGLIRVGDLVIDEQSARVQRSGVDIALTGTECRVLAALARARGQVVSKPELLTSVWGYDGYDPNIVEVHVSSLRRRLEAAGPQLIQTIRGRGYLLDPH